MFVNFRDTLLTLPSRDDAELTSTLATSYGFSLGTLVDFFLSSSFFSLKFLFVS
jgi:hypothetical protein